MVPQRGVDCQHQSRGLHAVAGTRARTCVRGLRRAVALVGGRSRSLLAVAVGLFPHRLLGTAQRGAGTARDARGAVVSRGTAQLRATHPAPRARKHRCAAVSQRAAGPDRSALGRIRGSGARGCHPVAQAGRGSGRSCRIVYAEHPADGCRHAGHHQHRCRMGERVAGFRRARCTGPVHPTGTQGAVLRRRLSLWRQALPAPRRSSRNHRRLAGPGAGDLSAVSRQQRSDPAVCIGADLGPVAGAPAGGGSGLCL